jgi:hypothetical protein
MASRPTRSSKRSTAEEPPSPPLVETRVGTHNNPSSGKMTCVDYGPDCKSIPAYDATMWCRTCDTFESDKHLKPKLKQTGRYILTFSHKEDGNPQMKEEGWLAKRQRRSQTPEDSTSPAKKRGPSSHPENQGS